MGTRSDEEAKRGRPRNLRRSSSRNARSRPSLARALRRLLRGFGWLFEDREADGWEIGIIARVEVKGTSFVLCRYRRSFRRLSPREKQVTLLAMEGFPAKSIASRLRLSIDTVKVYFRRIYSKLSVDSRLALFRSSILEILAEKRLPREGIPRSMGRPRVRGKMGPRR